MCENMKQAENRLHTPSPLHYCFLVWPKYFALHNSWRGMFILMCATTFFFTEHPKKQEEEELR